MLERQQHRRIRLLICQSLDRKLLSSAPKGLTVAMS